MDRDAELRRLRAGSFKVNNGRVLMTINLLRQKYNSLRSVEQGVKYEGIEKQEFIDSVNFLADEGYIQLATPISNGGLTLTPPGYFSGSARGGISQYHFYWLPPKEGTPTFFRPLVCHSLLVPGCISVLFPRLHSLLSTHNTLLPRNVCLPILPDTLDACRKASGYSSLSDTT